MHRIKSVTISVIAVGLLAGSTIGVAAQDGGAKVTGTAERWNQAGRPDPDGSLLIISNGVILEMSDPRLSGRLDLTTYGAHWEGDGDGLSAADIGTDVVSITNDDGAWSGQGVSILLFGDDDGPPTAFESTWHLVGQGAYEGLSAYLKVIELGVHVEGVLVEGVSATVGGPA